MKARECSVRCAFTAFALTVTGLVHLIPAAAVLGPQRLANLYGITISDGDLALLLRHRAILFAIVAGACFAGAARRSFALPALAIATASVFSFVILARSPTPTSSELRNVATVDIALTVLLVLALLGEITERRRHLHTRLERRTSGRDQADSAGA